MKKYFFIGIYFLCISLCSCKEEKKENKKPVKKGIVLDDPNMPDSIREINIDSLADRGDYKNAVGQLDLLLAKNPDNPEWLYKKAVALEQMEDTIQAITFYEKAILTAGNFPEASLKLAIIYAEQGNNKSLDICNSLLKNPSAFSYRSEILYTTGIYFIRVNQSERAIQLFDQLIKEDYTFLDAYLEKGILLFYQNKYAEARNVFEKSTSVKNTFADGYYWTAKCDERMNNKTEAIDNYKRSIALDKGFTEAKEALARLESNQ